MMSPSTAMKILRFMNGAPTSLSAVREHPCCNFAANKYGPARCRWTAGRMPALLSVLKIDFSHRFSDAAAELDDLNVIGVDGIRVQDGAVTKDPHQTNVVRLRRMQCVDTDRQAFNSRHDGTQRSQARQVFVAGSLRSFGAIFPNYDVGQHVFPFKPSRDS